jgi:hydrogenase/urease accessory protein HupE
MTDMLTALLAVAHEGHAGSHGWLAGAAQPLLALDHFLAGLFVLVMGALAMVAVGRRASQRGRSGSRGR